MDQNEEKSVWLRLILPICLGVFATAIYHNAIKTQKVTQRGLIATRNVEAGEVIDAKTWGKTFAEQPLIFHDESAAQIKVSFSANEIKATFGEAGFTANRPIEKGAIVSVSDFSANQ